MRSDGLYGNERGLFTRKRPNTSSSLWGACVVIILPRAWTDTRHLCNGASQPGERASGRVLCAGPWGGPCARGAGEEGPAFPGAAGGGSGATPREAAPPTSHSGAPCRRRAPGRGTRARTGRAVREFGEAARRGQRRVEPPHLVAAPAVSLWGHLLPFLCCLPCVTSYVVIRKNQAGNRPSPTPQRQSLRRSENSALVGPEGWRSRSRRGRNRGRACAPREALRFLFPLGLARRPSQLHSRGPLAPAGPR